MLDAHKNADRFSGFADLYDAARPACPAYVVEILTRYLGRRPQAVIDIGCGTGLSTTVWRGKANRIIGIEPSGDMLAQARSNAPDIEFVQAFSDDINLPDGIADIVTCSQSFHWMEPVSTLREVARLLKPGGVFAAYDCDWPPLCCCGDVESAREKLNDREHEIESTREEFKRAFVQYPKGRHLDNIRTSGHFSYAREVVFANTETADADRYFNVAALSQGGVQAILRKEPTLIEQELTAFRAAVDRHFGDRTLPIEFCYRLRLGIKS